MSATDEVDELIEHYQLALDAFMKVSPMSVQVLVSHRDDASLANPYGPPVRAWDEIAETMERAASTRRDGSFLGFETLAKYATADLANVVELERLESKVHGGEDMSPYALRVTMIFRPEDGEWKVVHRHADQVMTIDPPIVQH